MSDSKPCSCVCFFLIDHPYVPILKNLAHSYFLVASRNLSFVRPLVLHCGTLGKLTDKAGHDIPSSVQGKRFVAFQVPALLAVLPNARTSLQATWVQQLKMESSTVVKTCQQMPKNTIVAKCHQMFSKIKRYWTVNWIVNRIVKPRYSLVCCMSIISCPVSSIILSLALFCLHCACKKSKYWKCGKATMGRLSRTDNIVIYSLTWKDINLARRAGGQYQLAPFLKIKKKEKIM